MIDIKHKNLLSAVPLIVMLVACATPDRDNGYSNNSGSTGASPSNQLYPVTENYDLDAIDYTVKRGDRLSSIALEVTGQSDNWREIASFNGISDPRNLQTGTVLAIPTDLIVGYQGSTNVLVSQAESSTPTPEAQSSTLALRRNDVVEAPVVISPVNSNRDFDLNPIDPNATAAPQSYRGAGAQIKVVGSYYPKGIYTEPAAYSKLILRASPGSLFVLDSKVNDWYKIETANGSGYIRTSDAAIVEQSE